MLLFFYFFHQFGKNNRLFREVCFYIFLGWIMAIKYKCLECNIVLSGEGASRHYLANPTHKLEKLPPPLKPMKNNKEDN
jgi:hypothetical protein